MKFHHGYFSINTLQAHLQGSLLNSPNHYNHMNQADKGHTIKTIANVLHLYNEIFEWIKFKKYWFHLTKPKKHS